MIIIIIINPISTLQKRGPHNITLPQIQPCNANHEIPPHTTHSGTHDNTLPQPNSSFIFSR